MINTLNRYRVLRPISNTTMCLGRHKPLLPCLSILLVVFCLNMGAFEAKETILIDSMKSTKDKILMRMLEQTNSYIEYDRFIQSKPFKCKAILKNHLTSNYPQNATKINMELDYGRVLTINSKQQIQGHTSEQLHNIKRLDKILDLLNGKCLYYQTITFIYEYCHKEHVRQFDTHYTKAYNIKAQFEDISMGVYNPDFYEARKVRKGIKELTAEERKVRLPQKSDFSVEHNFLTVQDIDNKFGEMQIEQSEDGNLIFTNINILSSDQYYTSSPLFVELTCLSQGVQIRNYAMVVHPYSLVYTKKGGICDQYISHKVLPDRIQYFPDNSEKIIRVYGSYLYGDVEQLCGRNLAWEKEKGSDQYDNTFSQGSLLSIQLFDERTQEVQSHYVNIKKIYSSQLIEIEVALGKSFKRLITSQAYINSSTIRSKRLVANITKCEILFNKKLNLSSKIEMKYTGKGIMQVKSEVEKIKVGDNFGCIIKGGNNNRVKIVDFDITIAKNLWFDYYQTYLTTNTFFYQSKHYHSKQYFLLQSQERYCFSFVKEEHNEQPKNSNKFTSLVKLSSRVRTFKFNNTNMCHIFVITIKDSGIIKLITRATDGTIYTYLISQGQIIKMVQFSNGTKEIIKQNKYYQNSTQPTNQIHQNFVYLKIGKLPNGTLYGGLWKCKDYVYFPRFVLFGEELISLDRINGYAYIRILNVSNMRHSESLSIVRYMKKLQQHYMMKEQKDQSHLLLDKSYTIGYNYVSGKYCDQPVNKFRKTVVYLTCGKPWFQITKLLETSPCEYSIRIETTLLCKQGYKQVVQLDSNILGKGEVALNSGVICHPSQNLYSQVSSYLYIKKSIQLSLI